jgi:hypothetical protein
MTTLDIADLAILETGERTELERRLIEEIRHYRDECAAMRAGCVAAYKGWKLASSAFDDLKDSLPDADTDELETALGDILDAVAEWA